MAIRFNPKPYKPENGSFHDANGFDAGAIEQANLQYRQVRTTKGKIIFGIVVALFLGFIIYSQVAPSLGLDKASATPGSFVRDAESMWYVDENSTKVQLVCANETETLHDQKDVIHYDCFSQDQTVEFKYDLETIEEQKSTTKSKYTSNIVNISATVDGKEKTVSCGNYKSTFGDFLFSCSS